MGTKKGRLASIFRLKFFQKFSRYVLFRFTIEAKFDCKVSCYLENSHFKPNERK